MERHEIEKQRRNEKRPMERTVSFPKPGVNPRLEQASTQKSLKRKERMRKLASATGPPPIWTARPVAKGGKTRNGKARVGDGAHKPERRIRGRRARNMDERIDKAMGYQGLSTKDQIPAPIREPKNRFRKGSKRQGKRAILNGGAKLQVFGARGEGGCKEVFSVRSDQASQGGQRKKWSKGGKDFLEGWGKGRGSQ